MKNIKKFHLLTWFVINLLPTLSAASNFNTHEDALPVLSPLFAVGQNIYPKNSFSQINTLIYTEGDNFSSTNFEMDFLYAPHDRFSALAGIPIIHLKDGLNNVNTKGLGDIFLQTEFAYMEHKEPGFFGQGTGIFGFFLPSSKLNIGIGAFNVYFGGTFNFSTKHLYSFISGIFIPPTKARGEKISPTLVYEWGLGYAFFHRENFTGSILLEMNGIYSNQAFIQAIQDLTTGGNEFYIGPTINIETRRTKFQVGFQYPIVDRRFNPLVPDQDFRFGIEFYYYIVFD